MDTLSLIVISTLSFLFIGGILIDIFKYLFTPTAGVQAEIDALRETQHQAEIDALRERSDEHYDFLAPPP